MDRRHRCQRQHHWRRLEVEEEEDQLLRPVLLGRPVQVRTLRRWVIVVVVEVLVVVLVVLVDRLEAEARAADSSMGPAIHSSFIIIINIKFQTATRKVSFCFITKARRL